MLPLMNPLNFQSLTFGNAPKRKEHVPFSFNHDKKHYILNILSETKLLLVQDVQDQACTPLILN